MTTYDVNVTCGYGEQVIGPYTNNGAVVPAIGAVAGDQIITVIDQTTGVDWADLFLPVAPGNDCLCHKIWPDEHPPANLALVATMNSAA